ncbi:MAG: NAD(+)/NADH kinase, partial [Clostridia bacterium]|nr:NAD(+)/NADH kinase [Clostridia bacterium]
GGDGTIIHAAKLAAEASRPTLGINLGHLGFTAGLEISELSLLSKLLTGDYITEKRMMLDVRVVGGDDEERLSCHAMNDAVISRGSLATIIDLEVFHNDRSAMSFRADGVIVSPPTGTTAYSLSAGGPVIDPMIQCIEVTPVCAHSLHTRPILFAPDSTIRIEASKNTDHALFGQMNDRGIFLSVDGEMVYSLQPDESVIIEKSDVYADFIIIKRQSFAEVLKQKFVGK